MHDAKADDDIFQNAYTEAQQLYAYAKEARQRVMDYYGTAMHSGMRAAGADLSRASQMNEYEIIEEAKRLHLL